MSRTLRLRFAVPADQEEALSGWCWSSGASGLEVDVRTDARGRLTGWAYFAEGDVPGPEGRALLAAWCPEAALDEPVAVPERDWLETWRAGARPIEAGKGFLVDPREPEEVSAPVAAEGRFLLRLPARTAFGVGSHESTRLALALLEATGCAGLRVLDVGCGTGILAFAAQRLGAQSVVAFDLDPAAALLVPQYVAMNGLAPIPTFAGTLAALRGAPDASAFRFDLALVNVIPSEIEPELELLAGCLLAGARCLFSGILVEQEAEAVGRLAAHGFRVERRLVEGEWVALATRRAA